MLRGLVALCLISAAILPPAFAQEPKPPELTQEEQKLAAEAKRLNDEGIELFRAGQPAEAVDKMQQVLEIRRKLYPESKYPDGHTELANSLSNLGLTLRAAGSPEKALPYYEQSLAMSRKLYSREKFPDGHLYLAASLNNLGVNLRLMGQAEKGLAYTEETVAMMRKLYPAVQFPDGDPNLAGGLMNLASALVAIGKSDQALPVYEEALAMYRKLFPEAKYPDGHRDLANGLNSLGFVNQKLGLEEKGLVYLEQALTMWKKLLPESKFPNGHPELARTINNIGLAWLEMGQPEKALPYYEQNRAMLQKLYPAARYPIGHPELAMSFYASASVLVDMGQAEKALPYFEQALAMLRKLYAGGKYADGHPSIALTLDNMGRMFLRMGQTEKSLTYREQAVAMYRKLYPDAKYSLGHPDLAISLGNLGYALKAAGKVEESLPYYEQALRMCQKLYPESKYPNGHATVAGALTNSGKVLEGVRQIDQAVDYYKQALEMSVRLYPKSKCPNGHPFLAARLGDLGWALHQAGQTEQGLAYCERAESMCRQLYSNANYAEGHPNLAIALNTRGFLLAAMGHADQALPLCEESLAMQQKLLRRELMTASESAALDLIEAQPLYRDLYLSVSRNCSTAADQAEKAIWSSRLMFTRVLERRHANARAAYTAAEKSEQLRGNYRRIEQLLHDTRLDQDERDKLLRKYTEENEKLQREIMAAMSIMQQWKERDGLGPKDLAQLLPVNTVFLDFNRYDYFQFDRNEARKISEKRTPSYAAFVMSRSAASSASPKVDVRRVELGNAREIDNAVSAWRTAIQARQVSPAAERLRELLWAKLAERIPPGTKTLYISAPDGDLARLPWAALPIDQNKVLLEEYAVANVPHGAFLLEQLKWPPKYDQPDSVLALGNLAYNSKTWADLPATAVELKSLSSRKPVTLGGLDATPDRVIEELRKARFAHLATHGFFDAQTFVQEKKREDEEMKNRQFGEEKSRIIRKNPAGFVGVVLANSEILTGLRLIDQPLENLSLVTLSACETGLGDSTGGEGVQGLQRAFHLAGCPNVVASLWNVNDSATAALMAKFYHEMWVNKKPPIEALREAQLTIYHHPELIAELAGERGAPNQKRVLELLPEELKQSAPAKPQAGAKADTKLWAAFVLSGVGK
jgi:tetratricopeptide (TPR) repeat protein